MGVPAGCNARRRLRGMAIPCKQPATPQCARQRGKNVQVIHGQPLSSNNPEPNTVQIENSQFVGCALDSASPQPTQLKTDKVLDEAAIDPYVFVRDAYLQRRRALVYDGNPPRAKNEARNDIRSWFCWASYLSSTYKT